MDFETVINNYVHSVKIALASENWYAALFVSLTLPDICGKYAYPSLKSSAKRYANWFDQYLTDKYTAILMDGPKTYLNGDDCYALRCAYLHEGSDDISNQRARDVINKFNFISPPPGLRIHKNYSTVNGFVVLQLQVDLFCNDICDSIERWLNDIKKESNKISTSHALLEIRAPF